MVAKLKGRFFYMKRKIVDKKQKSPKQKVDYAILFRHLKI